MFVKHSAAAPCQPTHGCAHRSLLCAPCVCVLSAERGRGRRGGIRVWRSTSALSNFLPRPLARVRRPSVRGIRARPTDNAARLIAALCHAAPPLPPLRCIYLLLLPPPPSPLVDCDVPNYALTRSFLPPPPRQLSVFPFGRRQRRRQHFLLPKVKKIRSFLRAGRSE